MCVCVLTCVCGICMYVCMYVCMCMYAYAYVIAVLTVKCTSTWSLCICTLTGSNVSGSSVRERDTHNKINDEHNE